MVSATTACHATILKPERTGGAARKLYLLFSSQTIFLHVNMYIFYFQVSGYDFLKKKKKNYQNLYLVQHKFYFSIIFFYHVYRRRYNSDFAPFIGMLSELIRRDPYCLHTAIGDFYALFAFVVVLRVSRRFSFIDLFREI